MNYKIDDRRTPEEKLNTWRFVVATDSFLSGWGQAPGRSIYAIAVSDRDEANIVEENMRWRSEMKRVRLLWPEWKPKLHDGDHFAIVGKSEASRFFEPGGFRPTSRYAEKGE